MKILAIWLLSAGAAVAGAAPFAPPPGCNGFLTVQTKDCRVEHHWTCEGEAEGNQWIMVMDGQGPSFLQQVNRDFVWLKSFNLGSSERREIAQSSRKLNSLTNLLETGVDAYDFDVDIFRENKPAGREHVVGHDRFVEKTVVIDGEPLMSVAFSYEETSTISGEIFKSFGTQYVSEKYRTFFLGQGTEITNDKKTTYDATPLRFVEPGETGFFTTEPQFGCNQIMSELKQPMTTAKENENDI